MGLGRNIMISIVSASILGCNPGCKNIKSDDFEGDSEKIENEASLPKNEDLSEVQEGTKKFDMFNSESRKLKVHLDTTDIFISKNLYY